MRRCRLRRTNCCYAIPAETKNAPACATGKHRSAASDVYKRQLFRQSVRYCVNTEQHARRYNRCESKVRSVLPKMLDEHRLLDRELGNRKGDDSWIRELSHTVFAGTREQAVGAVAAALAEGYDPEEVGEAMSLAANQLLLRDPGRDKKRASMRNGKTPVGSVRCV